MLTGKATSCDSGIIYEQWFKSQLFCVQFSYLPVHLGKQQKKAQVFGPQAFTWETQ